MSEADRLTIGSGVAPSTLMDNAGSAVADAVDANYPVASVLVLCGPGNNGGDGFAAAAHLRKRGYDVCVSCLGEPASLEGDAAEMAKRWRGPVSPFTPNILEGATLIVDAIFGAGLSRPLNGPVVEMARAANAGRCPTLAVDVPSGMHGDTGRPLDGKNGLCFLGERTVTFFRKKRGHVLLPGWFLCGTTNVADIAIPEWVLNIIRPRAFENGLAQWRAGFPRLRPDAHKYQRGHAVLVSGPIHATGAARLAARGALRVGAGLVRVAKPPAAIARKTAPMTAIMVQTLRRPNVLSALRSDQ